MLRSILSTVAPRASAAKRSLATAAARRAPFSIDGIGPTSEGAQPLTLDRWALSAATSSSRLISARRCSWRDMSSASAKVASSGGGDSAAYNEEGAEGEMGSGRDARDPATGEGIWMDDEDEVV